MNNTKMMMRPRGYLWVVSELVGIDETVCAICDSREEAEAVIEAVVAGAVSVGAEQTGANSYRRGGKTHTVVTYSVTHWVDVADASARKEGK